MMSADETMSARRLIESFATTPNRFEVYTALQRRGRGALAAVREGLRHPDWHVRHWCAIYLDRNGDAESIGDLLPLLHDPVAKVRLWAVHTISCQHCKDFECPYDLVELLSERIENDESLRVRKMAVTMLAEMDPDPRIAPILRDVLERETDRRILLHANRGLRHQHET